MRINVGSISKRGVKVGSTARMLDVREHRGWKPARKKVREEKE